MAPLISIVIPCYNHAIYLKDCLNSILNQSFQNWEAIVVNDGSTDNTTLVTMEYCQKDKRIRLVEKENGGLSSARNYGMRTAEGQWLNFLDADDFLLEGHLSAIVIEIAKNIEVKCIQTGYCHFNENASTSHHSVLPYMNELMPGILTQNVGPVHTIVIRKDVIQTIGQFDESLNSCEDWDMWIRLGKAGIKKVSILKPLVGYRRAGNSMSRNGFQMYNALKLVTLRAFKKDSRLPTDMPGNREYQEVDIMGCLKKSLILCIGVNLMQGKIRESVELFKTETKSFDLKYVPADFTVLNSYLSFRYMDSKPDVSKVLKEFMPVYNRFFLDADFENRFSKKAMKAVFKKHQQLNRKYNYFLLGQIFNKVDAIINN